jgi:ubiquinone biosynthesis protein
LAAASTGQVHAATLHSGESVIVKVRRPNIDVIVKGDLNVMQDVIDTAERRLSSVRQFGLSALFREFAENVVNELDYTNEADQARLLGYNMRNLAFVHVPAIYAAYSTSKVVTQERVEGVKISELAALDAGGVDREEVAQRFFRALLQQVLLDGFFHADLHPGNVWVNLPTGRIIFLDMGMVGRLTRSDRILMGQLIWALQDRDSQALSRVLVSICHVAQGYDSIAFQYDIERLVNRYLVLASAAPGLQAIMGDLGSLLLRYGLRLRKEFTLAFKAMGQGESIMRTLLGDKPPDYIIDAAYATLKDALVAQLTPENVTQHLIKPFARDVAGRLPALLTATSALLDDFGRGQSLLQMDPSSIDQRVHTVQAALEAGVRRVVLSVLLVGLLLGSTLFLLVPFEGRVSPTEALVLRLVAEFGFVAAALLIVGMVINTIWQATRNPKQF